MLFRSAEDKFAEDQIVVLDEEIESLREILKPKDEEYGKLLKEKETIAEEIKEVSASKDKSKAARLNESLAQVKEQIAELAKERTDLRSDVAHAYSERSEYIEKIKNKNDKNKKKHKVTKHKRAYSKKNSH